MQEWRQSRWRNPAAWFTLIGLLLLAVSIWVPFQTAARTARTEQRADQIATLLLEVVRDFGGELDAATVEIMLARFHRLARRDGVYVTDLELVEPPLPDTVLLLQNKHYAFQVAVSPPDPRATVGAGALPALEVVAWPLTAVGPGHSVFFHPDNAPRAYTRNLAAGYAGLLQRRPTPGKGHRRSTQTMETAGSYRGFDDERWILY